MIITKTRVMKAARHVDEAFSAGLNLDGLHAFSAASNLIKPDVHLLLCHLLGISDTDELNPTQSADFLRAFSHRCFPAVCEGQIACPRIYKAAKDLIDHFFVVVLPAVIHDTASDFDFFQMLYHNYIKLSEEIGEKVSTVFDTANMMRRVIDNFTKTKKVDQEMIDHMKTISDNIEKMRVGNYLDLFESMHTELMRKVLVFFA